MALFVGLFLASPASARQQDSQWRERLIGEFAAAVSGRGAPDDLCLSLYRNGELLYESDGAESFIPASLMKLATAAVALEVMGPDGTYTTEVVADADALAQVRNGVLRGDLYLVGGGDPTLSTRSYAATFSRPRPYTDANDLADMVMAALRARGVRVIDGAVVGDESRYPEAERDYTAHYIDGEPVWKASYRDTNLSGPLSALMINDGYHPHAASRRGHTRPADVARAAAAEFDDLLEERGMMIRRWPRSQAAPGTGRRVTLGSLESIPMSQIVERMLTHSDNTTSEMVLKEIGHRNGGSTRAHATASAAAILRGMVGEAAGSLRWADGSGLSAYNRMSCDLAARLLVDAGAASPMVQALAVAGKTGTLRNCGPAEAADSEPRNAVRAKSGSLNDIDALAGVVVAAGGDVVAFAMIASEHLIILRGSCNQQRRALITAAANYTYGPADPASPDDPAGPDDPAHPSGPPKSFIDIGAGVHAPAVMELVEADVALACDAGASGRRFCGDDPIPRHEAAWYLASVLALPAADSLDRFVDVEPSSEHAASIAALAAAGITYGCSSSGPKFCPDRLSTRAQVASLLSRAFGLVPPATVAERFNDVEPGSVHEESILALAHAGITRGCSSARALFCPDRLTTRAEFATLLSRALSHASSRR